MNAKLIALYKEFPWLITLKEKIGNSDVVKVQKFGSDVLSRWAGRCITNDDGYFIYGYFFDKNGTNLGKIHPEFDTFWTKVKIELWIFTSFETIHYENTVQKAIENLENMDEIRYVVLFGHDLNHYMSSQLYVYKLPKDKVMSEIIELANLLGTETRKEEVQKATTELNKDLVRLK